MISTQFLCTLGDDPTIKEVNGTQVAEFRGAVDIYDPSTKQRRAQWVRVTVWGARATTVAEWLHKGSQAMVVGSMTVREYEARDGRAGFSVEVKASDVVFARGQRGDSDRDNNRNNRDDSRQRGGGSVGGGWGDKSQRTRGDGGERSGQRGNSGGGSGGGSQQGDDPIPF